MLVFFLMIDADTASIHDRRQELDKSLIQAGLDRRSNTDPIVILIPKRNIETWIHFLRGNSVDENTVYPKLKYQSDCEPEIQRFHEICPNNMPEDAPDSLKEGCEELKRCPV
jgi:hypothetical protein